MPKIYFEKLHAEICQQADKPVPANKYKPSWWKESDYYDVNFKHPVYGDKHRKNSTIKNCPAISDSMNMGYIFFTPLDIEVDATDEHYLYWRIPKISGSSIFGADTPDMDFAAAHAPEQMQKLNAPKDHHRVPLKINTYFGIRTEPGYSIWVTHPMYNWDLPYTVMNGIIDSDTITTRFPYPLFIKQGFRGVIPKGTPLIQVIPFKRESYESEFVDLDVEDVKDKVSALSSDQITPYRKLFWSRKKFT